MIRFASSIATGLLVALAAGWLAGWIISDLADEVVLRNFDRPLIERVAELRTPSLNDTWRTITSFGGNFAVGTMLAFLTLVSYLRTRSTRLVSFFLAAIGGTFLLSNVLKLLVARPRPAVSPLVDVQGNAFPSGHASAGAILFFTIALLATRGRTRPTQVLVWTICGLGALLIAASRVYLGVHWPTDVLGGLALGAYWVYVCAAATGIRSTDPELSSTE